MLAEGVSGNYRPEGRSQKVAVDVKEETVTDCVYEVIAKMCVKT